MIDYAAINASLYDRVATHADGAAVRALVGQGAVSSIFPRRDLKNVAGRLFPWLVWAAAPASGDSGDMRQLGGAWWIYGAPNGDEYTLLAISAALETLYGYTNALAIPGGRIGVTFRGAAFESRDPIALGMEVRISYTARG